MEILGWILFSLFCGVMGLFFILPPKGFKKTTAVITGIKTRRKYRNGKPHHEHITFVEYTVDGVVYHSNSEYHSSGNSTNEHQQEQNRHNSNSENYSSGHRNGKTITIYYDPNDPKNIHIDSKRAGVICLIICILGIAALVSKII